jgi:hypothetical protein
VRLHDTRTMEVTLWTGNLQTVGLSLTPFKHCRMSGENLLGPVISLCVNRTGVRGFSSDLPLRNSLESIPSAVRSPGTPQPNLLVAPALVVNGAGAVSPSLSQFRDNNLEMVQVRPMLSAGDITHLTDKLMQQTVREVPVHLVPTYLLE